jgi:glucose/arabinose dehydrogenase/mono/diheme cytochrome c family protein
MGTRDEDEHGMVWGAFFGVVAAGLLTVCLVLAVAVGILIGHFWIHGADRSRTVTVASRAPTSTTSAAPARTRSIPARLVPIGAGLKGPVGTKASVYTTGLVNISDLAYDSTGRLWATVTGDDGETGSETNGVYLLRPGAKPDQILGGTRVKYPVGLVWAGNTLIVSDFGYIEAWTGFNGRTFAQHKILFRGLAAGPSGWTDNGALGPDGRIYVQIAAACDGCEPHEKLEADIISFRPDGSGLTVVATHVRGNTFSEFMPGTGTLFAAMNQQNALNPTPDDQLGIIKQGQDWGFPTCYGQSTPACAGIARAIAVLPKHNGTSAMALTDGQLGPYYGDSAFVASVVRGTVDRVALRKVGDTYVATGVYEFVSGLKATDGLLLTPQRQLLIGDHATGKVYLVTVSATTNPGASATIAYHTTPTVQAAAPRSATTSSTAGKAGTTTVSAALAPGLALFKQNCGQCHTLAEAGTDGQVGPDLDQLMPSDATVLHQVTYGGGIMPSFGTSGILSKSQIAAVAKFVSSVAGTSSK